MSMVKRGLLWLMGAFYVFAGVMHFVNADFYVAIMPPYLPWHLGLVWLSGLAEIAVGVGVLIPRTRVAAAWGTIALLIAVFPANLDMALRDVELVTDETTGRITRTEGADVGARNWIRLPFQVPLLLWAWWYTRPEDSGSTHG